MRPLSDQILLFHLPYSPTRSHASTLAPTRSIPPFPSFSSSNAYPASIPSLRLNPNPPLQELICNPKSLSLSPLRSLFHTKLSCFFSSSSFDLPMGNYVSCTLSAVPNSRSRAVKVILPSGDVQRIVDGPVNAAELMLDTPGHFLVNSRSMQPGQRFAALSADEDLEIGDVFVMMPMKRLNSIVTAADMARLLLVANKEVRKSRVLPESSSSSSSSSSSQRSPANPVAGPELDDVDDDVPMAMGIEEFKRRLSMRRSRKPTLETIAEEGISSR